MTHTIDDQHFEHLQRMAERAAFMYSVLTARMAITHSLEIREFTEYLTSTVDEHYPEVPLYAKEVA